MSGAENRVAIVTGGSRGIGRAVSLLLAERGYAVCLSYVSDAAAAQAVVDAIIAKGGTALAVKGDVGTRPTSSPCSRRPTGSGASRRWSTMPASST